MHPKFYEIIMKNKIISIDNDNKSKKVKRKQNNR